MSSTTAVSPAVPTLTPPAAESRPCDPTRRVLFSVTADADPGTLPRVLELVAKRGLVPHTLASRLTGDMLLIELEVVGMVHAESDHVGRCLQQIPMVGAVVVTDSAALAAAAE